MASPAASHPPMAGLVAPKRLPKRTPPLMTAEEIEARIAQDELLFILHGQVIKANAWLKFHPGGDKSILHMVGKDASDEVDALHSAEARGRMLNYRVGRIEGPWHNFIPPIQGGVFRCQAQIDQAKAVSGVAEGLSSSPATSRPPSPVFDDNTHKAEGVRQRNKPGNDAPAPRAESVSSVTTIEEDMDGMSYLDSVTHEHIKIDLESYPSPDIDTQVEIIIKYRKLHQRLYDEGLFKCNYRAYAVECSRYLALFIGMLVCLRYGYYKLAAFCLGGLWHQLVFSAHDAGHMGITHDFHVDSVIGIIIADFIGGLSLGWWKRNHNVHHIVTNAPEHDPDIEHMPLFAVSHRLLGSLRSSYYDRVMEYDAAAKFLLRIQTWTYYPLLSLGRFNLYRLSWDYLFMGRAPKTGPAWWHQYLEFVGQVFFWYWFGYILLYKTLPDNWTRFCFVMISHMTSSPLHLQIVLSHFAMSSADLGPQESFPQRMLRTTMDVDCPEWLDFIHGGLQFQAIHHLYPRIPRHNLRTAQSLVQEFCNDVGVPYALYGFTKGNERVIGRLADVSRQAAILAKCQKAVVESGEFGVFH